MREEGKVGKFLGRKVLCAEMALGVENSICMSVRTHNRHSASLDDFAGDVSALLRNVGQRQARELRKVLWFGRTCLELLEGAAFCKHLVEFLFAPSGLYRGERFLFRLGVLRGNRLGRRHRKLHDVRIVDKAFLEQLLEPAGRDLPAKRGEYRIVAERICRVAAVVPELGRIEIDIKPTRRGTGVFLPDMKLGAVENRLYAGVVEPFCGKAGKRFANRFADGIDILGLDALDRQSRPYLRHLAAAPVEVFAKPRVDERLFQRRRVFSGNHGDKHFKRAAFLSLVEAPAHPSSRDIHLALGLFVRPYLVFHRLLGADWTLKLNGRVHDLALIRRKEAVELRKNRLDVHGSVEEYACVGRMVEAVVEVLVHLERERRYRCGIATRHKAIRSVGEEQSGDLGVKPSFGV